MHQSKFTHNALGTTWWIEIFDELSTKELANVEADCTSFIDVYEAKYSRFRSNSLITKLNTERSFESPEQELIDLLQYGKAAYLKTNTIFNILTGHIQEAHGYDAAYSFTETTPLAAAGNPVLDIEIGEHKITLAGESKIDLGGFGKGYLIDLVAERLRSEHDVQYFLINGGGDIFTTSHHDKPIRIYLENPLETSSPAGSIELHNQAFAASSPHKRSWPTAHGKQNHIIGESADSSMIIASDATTADLFATVGLLVDKPTLQKFAIENEFKYIK